MNLSANFKRSENACKCMECNQYGADVELVDVLEELREQLRLKFDPEAIIIVNSWFRCRAHNNRPADQKNSYGVYGAGSNDNSWHLSGAAADVRVPGIDSIDVYQLMDEKYPDQYGIGHYSNFVHIDVRPTAARWCA